MEKDRWMKMNENKWKKNEDEKKISELKEKINEDKEEKLRKIKIQEEKRWKNIKDKWT